MKPLLFSVAVFALPILVSLADAPTAKPIAITANGTHIISPIPKATVERHEFLRRRRPFRPQRLSLGRFPHRDDRRVRIKTRGDAIAQAGIGCDGGKVVMLSHP